MASVVTRRDKPAGSISSCRRRDEARSGNQAAHLGTCGGMADLVEEGFGRVAHF